MKGLTIAVLGLLAGCASGYSQFYQPREGATPEIIAAGRAMPAPKEPRVERSDRDPREIVDSLERYGYQAIGFSSFTSGRTESESGARAQGGRVGADLVIVSHPQYVGSVTTSVPITTPTQRTSYTTGTATAYGSGGYATAYGNSTTTTYGSQTSYIPITVNRHQYTAIYFVKWHYVFGANWRELTNEERRQIGSNRGAYITNVIYDTPAFNNDILPGDIVLSVNGQSGSTPDALGEIMRMHAGQSVELEIVRNGLRTTKLIRLLD